MHTDRAVGRRSDTQGFRLRVPTRFVQKYTVRTRPEPSVLSHFVALDRAPDRLRGPDGSILPAINRRRKTSWGCQDRRTALPVHARGDVLDPLEAPSAVGPVLAGQFDGQRSQVDAQRRPTRGHLDPALVAVAELHARAVDQQQPWWPPCGCAPPSDATRRRTVPARRPGPAPAALRS